MNYTSNLQILMVTELDENTLVVITKPVKNMKSQPRDTCLSVACQTTASARLYLFKAILAIPSDRLLYCGKSL